MGDSSYFLKAHQTYFVVNGDKEWKSLSVDKFLRSMSSVDPTNDDFEYLYADPESLSIRRLIQEWGNTKSGDHRGKPCDLCDEAKSQLLKLGKGMNTVEQTSDDVVE